MGITAHLRADVAADDVANAQKVHETSAIMLNERDAPSGVQPKTWVLAFEPPAPIVVVPTVTEGELSRIHHQLDVLTCPASMRILDEHRAGSAFGAQSGGSS